MDARIKAIFGFVPPTLKPLHVRVFYLFLIMYRMYTIVSSDQVYKLMAQYLKVYMLMAVTALK